MTDELIGKTLSGRYRFETLLGSGTFADVYRITDLHRRATLAAKVLRADIARDSRLLERFQREATVLARLQHPNIVRYYDIVEAEDYRFILMDYIPGHTLNDILQATEQPLRPSKTLDILTPLASALHFAHNEGIIHRDLKPANILLHENGTLYVTDFGIARLLNVTSELTMGAALGTPLYMAPEQITGDPVTVATDIYALGVLLYRMYTGRVPFRGDSPSATGPSIAERITYEHMHSTPPPPTAINPQLDLAVQEIVLRCLQKDPARRYRSISTVYDALAEAIGAPPIDIDDASITGEYRAVVDTTSDDPNAPPQVKLPEWSQFMPPVEHAGAAATEDDESDQAETLPNRIEHPVPQPETEPHLEDQLRESARTLAHQPPADMGRTMPSAPRVQPPAHPTPRHLARPPQPDHIAPPQDTGPRRMPFHRPRRRTSALTWAAIAGALLVLVTLCLAVLYFGGFLESENQANPEADITLSARPGTLPDYTAPPLVTQPLFSEHSGGNRIAFDSRRSGNLDIYIINADGTNLQQLTGTSGAERGPAWSPDGSQIAFYGASTENGNYDIYVINTDGTNLRNLTNSPDSDDRYPTWSPDGTRIAFHSNQNGDFDIFVIDAGGDSMRAVTTGSADDIGPDWSPDGTQIAYHTSQWDFPYELAILDLNSGQVRRLTNNDDTNTFPTWSPNGRQIVYNAISSIDASANIYVMDTDGSNRRQLTFDQERNVFPDWSADGTQIIFQRGLPDVSAIYTIPVSGGNASMLTAGRSDFLPDWEPFH